MHELQQKMTGTPVFQRLIRFIDEEGKEQYGDVPLDVDISKIESNSATVITGDVKSGFSRTSNTAVVKKVKVSLHKFPLPSDYSSYCVQFRKYL